jgi:transcription elongation factor Elf1
METEPKLRLEDLQMEDVSSDPTLKKVDEIADTPDAKTVDCVGTKGNEETSPAAIKVVDAPTEVPLESTESQPMAVETGEAVKVAEAPTEAIDAPHAKTVDGCDTKGTEETSPAAATVVDSPTEVPLESTESQPLAVETGEAMEVTEATAETIDAPDAKTVDCCYTEETEKASPDAAIVVDEPTKVPLESTESQPLAPETGEAIEVTEATAGARGDAVVVTAENTSPLSAEETAAILVPLVEESVDKENDLAADRCEEVNYPSELETTTDAEPKDAQLATTAVVEPKDPGGDYRPDPPSEHDDEHVILESATTERATERNEESLRKDALAVNGDAKPDPPEIIIPIEPVVTVDEGEKKLDESPSTAEIEPANHVTVEHAEDEGGKVHDLLSKRYKCPLCANEDVVECKMDFKAGIGSVSCRLCGAAYQMSIDHSHEPIDIFAKWLGTPSTTEIETPNHAVVQQGEVVESGMQSSPSERAIPATEDRIVDKLPSEKDDSPDVEEDEESYEEIVVDDDDEFIEYIDEILEDGYGDDDADEEVFTEVTYDSQDLKDQNYLAFGHSSRTSLEGRPIPKIKSATQKALEGEAARKKAEAEEAQRSVEFRIARRNSFTLKDAAYMEQLRKEEEEHMRQEQEREQQRILEQERLSRIQAEEAARRIAQESEEELRKRLQLEEARRKAAEAEAHRLAAEAATREKEAKENARREAEEAERREREAKKRAMEDEVRLLEAKLAEAKIAAEEAKKREKEEKKRLQAKIDARRKEKKMQRLSMTMASSDDMSSPSHVAKGTIDTSSPLKTIYSPVRASAKPAVSAAAPPPLVAMSSPVRTTPPPPPPLPVSAQPPLALPAVDFPIEDADGVYYTVEELRKQTVPGLDYKNREIYLHPSEYPKLFGMSKTEFDTQPKWKKTQLKRKQKLF